MDTSIGAQFEGYTQVNRKDRAKLLTDGTPGRRRSLTAEITGGYVAAVRHVAALPARHANTARHHTSLPATRVPAGLRCRRPAGTVSPKQWDGFRCGDCACPTAQRKPVAMSWF